MVGSQQQQQSPIIAISLFHPESLQHVTTSTIWAMQQHRRGSAAACAAALLLRSPTIACIRRHTTIPPLTLQLDAAAHYNNWSSLRRLGAVDVRQRRLERHRRRQVVERLLEDLPFPVQPLPDGGHLQDLLLLVRRLAENACEPAHARGGVWGGGRGGGGSEGAAVQRHVVTRSRLRRQRWLRRVHAAYGDLKRHPERDSPFFLKCSKRRFGPYMPSPAQAQKKNAAERQPSIACGDSSPCAHQNDNAAESMSFTSGGVSKGMFLLLVLSRSVSRNSCRTSSPNSGSFSSSGAGTSARRRQVRTRGARGAGAQHRGRGAGAEFLAVARRLRRGQGAQEAL